MTTRLAPSAYRLMLVTDRRMAGDRAMDDIVLSAVRGGVTSVQLREKTAPTRDFVDFARSLGARLAPLGVPLFINDRVDVALAAGLRCVHVGQSDMRPADVRRLMGPDAVIGLSITALAELRTGDLAEVDYLGVGPVHDATATKSDATPPIGLDGLAAVRAATALPIVAIGGLHAGNTAEVIAAGADGVAVVSAIMTAADPAVAAASFIAAMTA